MDKILSLQKEIVGNLDELKRQIKEAEGRAIREAEEVGMHRLRVRLLY